MNLSRLIEALRPSRRGDYEVHRDVRIPVRDGVKLLADHYTPTGAGAPVVLIRSPYGRSGRVGRLGPELARRGFQVLIQSVRGTFGSGGTFEPHFNEREDGLDTLAWISAQPWFSGEILLAGPSYLGYTQWAVADELPPTVKALSPVFSPQNFRDVTYPGESFALDTGLLWTYLLTSQETGRLRFVLSMLAAPARLSRALARVPLLEGYRTATRSRVTYYENWLRHNTPGDEFWRQIDFTPSLERVAVPVGLAGGWYDLFARHTVLQYEKLRATGGRPRLRMGPWTHGDLPRLQPVLLQDAEELFREALSHEEPGGSSVSPSVSPPVKLYVTGVGEWRGYEEWPPPQSVPERWHLAADGRLTSAIPAASRPDRYRYNPADPTPVVGGTTLGPGAGPRIQNHTEARPDILVYSSEPLARPVELIGNVHAEVFVRSTLEHFDLFVRLCAVDGNGRSRNICDGIQRISAPEFEPDHNGVHRVLVSLWPMAHRFEPGHRVRVQIASGAHPRFARNTGSGEPLATARRLVPADQEIFHDPERPSAVVVPLMRGLT